MGPVGHRAGFRAEQVALMKNILVTGGAGYIGSHAAKALANAGYRPVTYDNLVYGNHWAVQWGPFVEGDIGDRARLLKTFERYDIDAVMHFAAFAYVGESMTKPELYFENNVTKSLTLLDAMRTARIRNMVFSSTCATYGTPDMMPITEETPQNPVNPYGETKLMSSGRCIGTPRRMASIPWHCATSTPPAPTPRAISARAICPRPISFR